MAERHNTRQKALILDALRSSDAGATADELTDSLKDSGEKVGRATVYRYLKELETTGKVKKYSLGDSSRYQFTPDGLHCEEHFHLVCESCGRLEHLGDERAVALIDGVRDSFGFEIDKGTTVLYGICKNCKLKGGI